MTTSTVDTPTIATVVAEQEEERNNTSYDEEDARDERVDLLPVIAVADEAVDLPHEEDEQTDDGEAGRSTHGHCMG